MLWPQPPEPKFCSPGGLLCRRSQSSGCPHGPKKGRNTASAHTDMTARARGQPARHQQTEPCDKQQGRHLQASEHRRPGSPSGRTPWTSCPVTWLFGVERQGEAEASGRGAAGEVPGREQLSAPASPHLLEPQEGGLQGRVGARNGALLSGTRHLCPCGQDLRADGTHAQTPGPEPLATRQGLSRLVDRAAFSCRCAAPLALRVPILPGPSEEEAGLCAASRRAQREQEEDRGWTWRSLKKQGPWSGSFRSRIHLGDSAEKRGSGHGQKR